MIPTLATTARSPVMKNTTIMVVADAMILQVTPFKILRLCDSCIPS